MKSSVPLETRWISSLEKVFPKPLLSAAPCNEQSALQGEVFSLQLAYRGEFLLNPLEIQTMTDLPIQVQIRQVNLVPAEYLGESLDDRVLAHEPGLFPDLLTSPATFRSTPNYWHALWLTLRIPEDIQPGNYFLRLKLRHFNPYIPERCFEAETENFTLHVLNARQPKSSIRVASWFHCDCLYTQYHVEPWSDEFFSLLKNYWKNMTAHGENVIYVPLTTPPLDTWIGGERPTIQSVGIVHTTDGKWSFDFSKLERYIRLAFECGFQYLECSHLFTQWGSEFAPKVMIASAPGMPEEKCMGWTTPSGSEEYLDFLNAFLPALRAFLVEHHWFEKSYFHVSDEPAPDHQQNYRRAALLFRKHLQGGKFLDAVCHSEFFKNGLVDIPVPAVDCIEEFRELQLPERWSYYCVSQWNRVPNQFMHLPSTRNRVMGLLAYCYQLDGFLHWGYNFWFSQFSLSQVNPYCDSCAGRGFPPGDAFKVYPGADGRPEDSIRHEVFFEAWQDLAALQALEKIEGRDKVLRWLADLNNGRLPDMRQYPIDSSWFIHFRNQLNHKLGSVGAL